MHRSRQRKRTGRNDYYPYTEAGGTKKVTKRRVVLDAGHGGYDDGSVAADGTKEKRLRYS